MESKWVKVNPELFPNLVLHVMACGGIGLDEEYGKQHRETLTAEEMSQIKQMAEGVRVEGPAIAGPLFRILFQIPCYFPTKSVEEIDTVYDLTVRAVKEGSFAPFAQRYPHRVELIYRYIPHQFERFFFEETSRAHDLEEAVGLFKGIVQAVYERFYADHWLRAKERMGKVAAEVLERIEAVDVVKEWEMITALEFPYPRFHVILSEPTQLLGTSLLAEKGVFSARQPIEVIAEMVVHEIGTHTMLQARLFGDQRVRGIVMEDYNGFVRVVEAAC